MNVGFTIGKFAPFHEGHEFLIRTALNNMDKFYVVIYDTPQFDIEMETKINWIKSKFPDVEILKAYDSPKKYGLDEDSVKIQMEYLEKIVKGLPLTHFYSSEDYGEYVAKWLNIKNVVVDKERIHYNISGSMLRKLGKNLSKLPLDSLQ